MKTTFSTDRSETFASGSRSSFPFSFFSKKVVQLFGLILSLDKNTPHVVAAGDASDCITVGSSYFEGINREKDIIAQTTLFRCPNLNLCVQQPEAPYSEGKT